VGDQNVNTKND
jgi:Arabinose efflux permease